MSFSIETFVLGPLETNTHVVCCDGAWLVVDPAWESRRLIKYLTPHSAAAGRILLTHGHGDHIAGAAALKRAFPSAVVCCPAADADMLGDPRSNLSAMFGVPITAPPAEKLLHPGDVLRHGGHDWAVLDTSGHTPGGVSYYSERAGVVFTGDSLFAGSVGRVDFPGASAGRLLKNIRVSLLSLPEATRVLSGHGHETSIHAERRENPFLKDSYKRRAL